MYLQKVISRKAYPDVRDTDPDSDSRKHTKTHSWTGDTHIDGERVGDNMEV
jgi:hypothetical protein